MRTNYFFIIALLFCLNTSAQVAGYMGKRFSIGYSNDFFPRLPDAANQNFSRTHAFNTTHCVDIDYTLNHSASICGSFQYANMDFFKGGLDYTITYNNDGNHVYYLPADEQPMQLISKGISIGFKFLRRNYINPYGKYVKIDFVVDLNKIVMDKDAFYAKGYYYPAYDYKKQTVFDGVDKFKNLMIFYSFGKQRIIANRLVLDYGLRLGLNTNIVLSAIDFIDGGSGDYVESELKKQANMRILQANLLKIHLGLRFLAF